MTNTLGVVVSEISNPFFPEIIRRFEVEATTRGFEIRIVNTEYDPQRARFAVRKMIDNRVCGLAVFTSQFEQKLIDEIIRNHIPIVSVGSAPTEPWISRITIDFAKGLADLLRHLVSLGHRRFAAVIGPDEYREKGRTADYRVLSCNYRHDGGIQSIHRLVGDPHFPTAILCANDLIALGAISALEQAGMRVPQDVSIVGFDDIVFGRLAPPPLTTSAVPRHARTLATGSTNSLGVIVSDHMALANPAFRQRLALRPEPSGKVADLAVALGVVRQAGRFFRGHPHNGTCIALFLWSRENLYRSKSCED